jgi:hypothetical protein
MTFAIMVVIAVGLPLIFYSWLMFDRLVKAEYEIKRMVWEADGKPAGFFWKAPECTFFGSSWARNWLSFVWLFSTPSWVAESKDYRTWLMRFRIFVLAWSVLIVTIFLALSSGLLT